MGDHDVVPARLDPTTAPWVIAIAASAGGFMGLLTILSSLPRGLPAAILIVLHRVPRSEDGLVGIFGKYAPMPVRMAVDGQAVEAGVVYLARSDQHLLVTLDGTFLYFNGGRIRHLQSSANPVMESAAAAFGRRPIAVVLSGTGRDGTDGVQSVKAHGGIVIAQDQASSEHWAMPQSAVKSGAVDYVLPLDDIGAALDAVVHGRPIGHGSAAGPVA
jgi:two-component system chemotaxis response regulator CheB